MVGPVMELFCRVDRGQATVGEDFSFQSLVISCIGHWEGVISLQQRRGGAQGDRS